MSETLVKPLTELVAAGAPAGNERRADVDAKAARVGELLREVGCDGLLLLEPENFSWLTSGALPRGLPDQSAVDVAATQVSAAQQQVSDAASSTTTAQSSAAAALTSAQSKLATAQSNLAGATLTSPITGTVASVSLTAGTQVGAGSSTTAAGGAGTSGASGGSATSGAGR